MDQIVRPGACRRPADSRFVARPAAAAGASRAPDRRSPPAPVNARQFVPGPGHAARTSISTISRWRTCTRCRASSRRLRSRSIPGGTSYILVKYKGDARAAGVGAERAGLGRRRRAGSVVKIHSDSDKPPAIPPPPAPRNSAAPAAAAGPRPDPPSRASRRGRAEQ